MNFPTTLSKVLSSLLLKGTKERKFRLGKISQDVTSNDTILHVEKKNQKTSRNKKSAQQKSMYKTL